MDSETARSGPARTSEPPQPRPAGARITPRSLSVPGDWTEEEGQLTPSLKLKRNVVMRENKDDVAALYV